MDNSAEDILRGAIFCDQIIPECTDSVSKTFPLSQLSIKTKFREHGTVVDLCSKATGGTYSGRKKSARTEENIAAVRNSVGRSPKKSMRRRSQELGMARELLRRVLTSDLHLYPYKIQIKQQLTDADKEKRVTMCEWFCNVLENDENFLEKVWFSDEAHFLLSGHVNSKNNVFWGSEVPDELLQRPLHSVKCTA